MARRSVTVNGQKFTYSIGTSHVKIDGVDAYCRRNEFGDADVAIKPSHIAEIIKRDVKFEGIR